VLDHSVRELARVFIGTSLECGYCAGQRSHFGAEAGDTDSLAGMAPDIAAGLQR
jgi:hypothetical protein